VRRLPGWAQRVHRSRLSPRLNGDEAALAVVTASRP
jgi:hypothetical protein